MWMSFPSLANLALSTFCPFFSSFASTLPVQPGTVMPPPATARAVSAWPACARIARGSTVTIASASAELFTRRIRCPFGGRLSDHYIPWDGACHSSERHHLARLDRFVGGDHDAQAGDRILHVVGQIQVLVNRPQQVALLALAQRVMIRLVGHVDALVRPRRVGVMPQDLVGFGVRVDVVGLDV